MIPTDQGHQPSSSAVAVIALCVLALTACGSHSSSGTQEQSAADAGTTAAPVAAAGGATGDTAGADLPVYPGATKLPMRAQSIPTSCGSKVALVAYNVAADARTVANWYKERMSGAVTIDSSDEGGDSGSTQVEILGANAAEAVVVSQMHFTGKLATAAKSIDADKTTLGFETFDPPLGQDYVTLMTQAVGSDPSAKQAARDKLTSMCAKG
jgi:hypothetical protein